MVCRTFSSFGLHVAMWEVKPNLIVQVNTKEVPRHLVPDLLLLEEHTSSANLKILRHEVSNEIKAHTIQAHYTHSLQRITHATIAN